MGLSLIVAMGRNRVIGVDNALPWHLSGDLKYFKATTFGKPIVMGRKTYDSIGRPLPGRLNIVISRDPAWRADGVTAVTSVEAALVAAGDAPEVMVIGGEQIYALALPLADKLYITEVDAAPHGDAFFPPFGDGWQQSERQLEVAEPGQPSYQFVTWVRADQPSDSVT